MFLKFNLWKKVLKKAWKGAGLIVGCIEDNYYISGGWWVMRVLKENMSNKEKAALIELIGEFPEDGEIFKATEGQGNQYEYCSLERLEEILGRGYKNKFYETRMIYQTSIDFYRVYQEEESDTCILMKNMVSELIDAKSIDQLEETPPQGPYGRGTEGLLMWENNIMKMVIFGIKLEEGDEAAEVITLLENIKLPAIGNRR